MDGKQEVGVITKEYAGLMKTLFSVEAQHTFGISCKNVILVISSITRQCTVTEYYDYDLVLTTIIIVPEDLDVKMKMVMVLAAIVIVSIMSNYFCYLIHYAA